MARVFVMSVVLRGMLGQGFADCAGDGLEHHGDDEEETTNCTGDDEEETNDFSFDLRLRVSLLQRQRDQRADIAPDPAPARLGLLMFNPHGECFMKNAASCKSAFKDFTDGLLLHTNDKYEPLDFGTLAYTNGQYEAPDGWGSFKFVCKARFIDDILLLYKKSAWKPVEGASRSACMEKKGRSLSRPFYVQAFAQVLPTNSTGEAMKVVVVSGHFPHRAGMKKGLAMLTKAVEEVKEKSGAEKVITIVDSNLGNSKGGHNPHRRRWAVAGPKIMQDCCGVAKGGNVQSSKIAFTCCARSMNIDGYDRIMASFGKQMKTVLPFRKAPKWSRSNFHIPVLGYLDY